MMRVVRACILVVLCVSVAARKYKTRCDLAKALLRTELPAVTLLGAWVCLIEKVNSNRDTALVTTKGNKKAYGLYQIPDKWCSVGRPGGDCNIACESLLDDDITDDTLCANTIFSREGFKYWPIYLKRCTMDDIRYYADDIYKCPGMSTLLRSHHLVLDDVEMVHPRRHSGLSLKKFTKRYVDDIMMIKDKRSMD